MARLARHSPPAAVELAVQHQPAADAGADSDHDDMLMPACGTELGFRPRRCVGVVLHENGPAGALLDLPRYRLIAPGKIWGEQDRRPALLDETGRADPDCLDLVPGQQFLDRLAEHLDGP